MSSSHPLAASLSGDDLRSAIERTIDRIAEIARTDIEPGRFFREVLESTVQVGGATRSLLWRAEPQGGWELMGEIPQGEQRDAWFIESRQELLTDVARGAEVKVLRGSDSRVGASANGHSANHFQVLAPVRLADQVVAILESDHNNIESGRLPADLVHFLAMLCELTAEFLSGRELLQLRRARDQWQRWDVYSQRLWQSLDLDAVCATIANDGRLLVECDRVSVAIRRGNVFQLKAVSGTSRIEPRASSTRSLEAVAQSAAGQRSAVWHNPAASSNQTDNPAGGKLDESVERHLQDSNATAVGIVPVDLPQTNDLALPLAIIVFEQFKPIGDFAGWKNRSELLVARSTATLRASIERSQIPFPRLVQFLSKGADARFRFRSMAIAGVLLGLLIALIAIPAEFIVSGTGELWPDRRAEVFASHSGIVDQILVGHGQDVKQGEPLVVLRDLDLENDAPRISGEIATVNERLKGTQAARFAAGNTADGVARSRQLTAEEEELKERLRTLERQRALIEERKAALTLRSPIDGKVLTWDVAQHLAARPVERGQSLLTVGDTAGDWIVEVSVAEKEIGHVLRARKQSDAQIEVDFMLTSEPGRRYRGHIREISMMSEYDDAARGHVRMIVSFDRNQIEQLRPGASAVPRISCGRTSIGYVWLHDLIDAVRSTIVF